MTEFIKSKFISPISPIMTLLSSFETSFATSYKDIIYLQLNKITYNSILI